MLSMTGTKFSRFLRLFTRGEFTHVSLAMDRELTRLYSFGRRCRYLPVIAGFVREDPRGGVFSRYDTRCLVCELPVTREEYLRMEKLISHFQAQYRQYHYNFLGLPFIALQIPWRCRRRFVCSQFVAYLLDRSGAARFYKDYSLMRPQDFYTLRGLHPIFKGALREYLSCRGKAPAV